MLADSGWAGDQDIQMLFEPLASLGNKGSPQNFIFPNCLRPVLSHSEGIVCPIRKSPQPYPGVRRVSNNDPY